MDETRLRHIEHLARAGTENAITVAEILHKHGLLDADDAQVLRRSVNNIDQLGLPQDLHDWKSGQIERVSALIQAVRAGPD
jgi:hypothetical protein